VSNDAEVGELPPIVIETWKREWWWKENRDEF
jgi:hypothetical protein